MITHSSRRNSEDLILDLDFGNVKSYTGAASTNDLIGITWGGDGSNQTVGTKSSVLVTDPTLKFRDYETYLYTPGTSLNGYLHGSGVDVDASRVSTVWTFAAVLRREDKQAITSVGVYIYFPSSGSGSGTIVDLGDGWYLVYRTVTGTSNYISLAGFYGLAANQRYYISGVCLTKTSYPVIGITKNTTRTNNVVDLSGTSTMNYTVGSSIPGIRDIRFNDTNDSFLYPSIISPYEMGLNSFSISVWANLIDTNVHTFIEARGASLAGYLLLVNYTTGKMCIFLTETGAPSGQRVLMTTNASLGTGYKNIIVIVDRTTSSVKFYVNGILFDSVSIPHSSSITPSSGSLYRIGYDLGGSTSNYSLHAYRHWKRAITVDEVLNEFESKRGRFGL